MNTGIIVDTSVWIEFLRNASSPLSLQLQTLLRSGRVFLVGMVLAEILQGIKSKKEADLVKRSMNSLPYLEMDREIFQKAGDLSAELRRKGLTVPLSDLLIATSALHYDCEVLAIDPHFDNVPGLERHPPATT